MDVSPRYAACQQPIANRGGILICRENEILSTRKRERERDVTMLMAISLLSGEWRRDIARKVYSLR